MVGDKFLDEFFELLIVVLDAAAFLGGEYHIFNCFYLGG